MMIRNRGRRSSASISAGAPDIEFGALSAAGVIVIPAGSNGTYSLPSGNEAGHFAVSATTGEVTLAAGGVGNISGRYTLTRQNGGTGTVYTVDIIADCLTVDPSHPYKKKINAGWGGDGNGDVEYTLTPNKPCLMGHCVGDVQAMPWALDPGGLTMDANPKPATRTVSLYPSGTGSRHVDGAVKNPAVAKGATIDWQCFDERHQQFDASVQPSFPVALAGGDILLLSKSVDAGSIGGNTGDPHSAYPVIHSVFCLSVLSSRPTGKIYRPGIWSGGKSWFAAVPQVDQSVIATVTPPPSPKDYSGSAVTLNYTTDFTDGYSFTLMEYTPGCGLALCGNTGYELGEVLVGCSLKPFESSQSRVGYRWPNGFAKQFTMGRLDSSVSSSTRQRYFDATIQMFIDLHSRALLQAEQGVDGYVGRMAEAQIFAGPAAKYIYDAGHQTMASEIWSWASTDDPTLSSGTLYTSRGYHDVTIGLKEFKSSNYATATVANSKYAITSATDTTITFNSSIDWQTLFFNNAESAKVVDWLYCQLFGVTNGGALGTKRFMVLNFPGNVSAWNRTGGTFNIYPSFSSQGLSAGSITEVQFITGTAEHRDWAAARSCAIIGHQDNWIDDRTYPVRNIDGMHAEGVATPVGAYWGLRVGQWTMTYMAAVGLTSPLWSGNLETQIPYSRLKKHFRYKRELGDVPFQASDYDSNYQNSPTAKAYYRYYLLDDLGFLGTNYVVPSTAA